MMERIKEGCRRRSACGKTLWIQSSEMQQKKDLNSSKQGNLCLRERDSLGLSRFFFSFFFFWSFPHLSVFGEQRPLQIARLGKWGGAAGD